MGKEADRLRRSSRFDLMKTCVIAIKGCKKPATTAAKVDTVLEAFLLYDFRFAALKMQTII